MLLPWLWVGALGGLLETLLAGFAAAAIGAVAAMLGGSVAGAGFRTGTGSRLLTGLAIGVPLLVLAAGTGGTGVNLAVMLAVPLLGFVAAALAPARLAVAGLIAVAVFGLLGFVEPDETLLLLGFHDVGYWALIGAAVAAGIAAALAALALAGAAVPRTGKRSWPGGWPRRRRPPPLIAAAVVYPAAGHPGFFGERLFVVMKDQAELRGMAKIADLTQRAKRAGLREAGRHRRAEPRHHCAPSPCGVATHSRRIYLVNGIEVDAGPAARRGCRARPDVVAGAPTARRASADPVARSAGAWQTCRRRPGPDLEHQSSFARTRCGGAGTTPARGIVIGSSD